MPIPAGTLRVVHEGVLQDGEQFAHSQDYSITGTPTQTDMNNFASEAVTLWNADFLTATIQAYFPTQTVWNGVRCYFYDGGSSAALVSTATGAKGGSSGGSPMPNQVAIVVTKLTGTPGRSHRGRAYLPGHAANVIAGGQMTLAQVTAMATAYAAYLTAMNAFFAGFSMAACVASVVDIARYPITQVRIDSRFDVQRRRADQQAADFSFLHSV